MRALLYTLMAIGALGGAELLARLQGRLSLALVPTLADIAVLMLGVWALALWVGQED